MGPKKLTQSFTGYRIFWSFAISFIWLEFLSLKREKYADEKVFLPSQKCFQLLCRRESSCLQGRVVATGRWLCLPPSMVSSSTLKYGMPPSVWYGTVSGLWWPLLGTNNPYNRSSGPLCRLLYFCTHHSIICHSESYWGLMGKPSP